MKIKFLAVVIVLVLRAALCLSGEVSLILSPDEQNMPAAQEDTVKKILDADSIESIIEPLPILSYDSNIGFGFGAKSFFLNLMKWRESFDVILFFSTEGERWIRFVFSIPDFELRQGTQYPLSFDLILDYDKLIAYNFYGIGNESNYDDEELFTKEIRELSLVFARGFSRYFVGQIGLNYARIESWGFDPEGQLVHLSPEINRPSLDYIALHINLRYDKRDSYIHPSRGIVIQTDVEKGMGNLPFYRWSVWLQHYTTILASKTILASRIGLSNIRGDNLPLQMMPALGGNRTLRGYSMGRFLDKSAALMNFEIRFPIYARLGGLFAVDAGRVWPSPKYLSFDNWHPNLAVGLRYYLETYLVRLDFGLSKEILGIYFNFNHIF